MAGRIQPFVYKYVYIDAYGLHPAVEDIGKASDMTINSAAIGHLYLENKS